VSHTADQLSEAQIALSVALKNEREAQLNRVTAIVMPVQIEVAKLAELVEQVIAELRALAAERRGVGDALTARLEAIEGRMDALRCQAQATSAACATCPLHAPEAEREAGGE
jgi:hypothetical protein